MKPLRKLLVAHIKQFVRERSALFWTFAFPVFFILIFGAVFSGEDEASFSVGVVMEDNSNIALGLSTALQQVPVFDLHLGTQEDELQALEEGDRRVVIIITSDFGHSISQGEKGNLEVYYDPAQISSQQVVLPIIYQVVDEFDRMLAQTPSSVYISERTLQSQNLRFIDYLVPGILGMALMQVGLFAAVPLVVERQNRVLKRLGATPLRRSTIVMSNVIFRLLIAGGQAALILVVARSVFDVPMLGSWLFLAGIIALGTLSFL
ncbi:MAG: ABC transporter permease, partial [Dehalococcoidia bacterium]